MHLAPAYGFGTLWQVGAPTVATCDLKQHDDGLTPHTLCKCGLYASRTLEAAWVEQARAHSTSYSDYRGVAVLGKVTLWGRVIEHERGFRAQYAQPLELYVPKGTDAKTLTALGETHGVPVQLSTVLPRTRWARWGGRPKFGPISWKSLRHALLLALPAVAILNLEDIPAMSERIFMTVSLGGVNVWQMRLANNWLTYTRLRFWKRSDDFKPGFDPTSLVCLLTNLTVLLINAWLISVALAGVRFS